jgi:hypothetical protein
MKLRIISSRNDIDSLNRNEQMVHLAFRVSNTDIFKLLKTCPKIKFIQVSTPYRSSLPKTGEMFLMMQGIELIEEDARDNRKDFDGYYHINEGITNTIKQSKSNRFDSEKPANGFSRDECLFS